MFRLVTQFCEKPTFLMLCDNLECGCTTTAEAVISDLNPIPIQQQEMAFLEQCKRSGWMLSMRICLCPGHHRQLQDFAAQRRSNIVLPNAQAPDVTRGQGGAGFTAE